MGGTTQTNADFFSGIKAGAVGLGGSFNPSFGFQTTGKQTPGRERFFPTIFDVEAGRKIKDFINTPSQIGQLGELARNEIATPENIRGSFSQFQESAGGISEALREGLATGFRTDVDPIIERARRSLFQETIPDITEQFAGSSGIASSDFGRALANAGRDLELDLGTLQVDADEAAAGRRSQLLPVAGDISAKLLATPTLFGSDLAGLEEIFRTQEEDTAPGAKLLENLFRFSELDQESGSVTKQKKPSVLGGIASILGGVSSFIPKPTDDDD